MFYKNIFIHIIYFIITICHFDSYSNETESGRKYIYSELELISLAKQALNLAHFNIDIRFAQRRCEKQEAMFSPYIPKLKVIKRVIKITKQYCAILEFIEQKSPGFYLLLTLKRMSLYQAQEWLQEGIKNFKEILDFVSNNTDPEINSKIDNFIIMNYHNLLLMDSNNTVKNYIIQKYKASLEYKIPLNKDGIPMIEVINQVIRYADRSGEKIIEINKKRNVVTRKRAILRKRRGARSGKLRHTISSCKQDYSKSENFGKTCIQIDYQEENTHDSCNNTPQQNGCDNKSEPHEEQQESTLMQDEQQESTQHSKKKKKHNNQHSKHKSAQEEQQESTLMQDEQQESIYHGKKKKKHNSHHTKHKLAQEEQNGKPDLIQDEQQKSTQHSKKKKKHNSHHSKHKLAQEEQNGKPDLIQDEQQEPIHHGKKKKKHNSQYNKPKSVQEEQQESSLIQDEQQESVHHSKRKKKHNSQHSKHKSVQEEQSTLMQDDQQEPIHHGKRKKKHNSHHSKHKSVQEEQSTLMQDDQQEPIHHGKRKKKHNSHHSKSKLMQEKQAERAVQIDYEENTHNSCDDAPLAQIDQDHDSNNCACNNEQPLIEQIDKEDNSSNYDNNSEELLIEQVYKENEAYITGEMQIEHKEYSDNIQEVEGAAKMDNQSYDSCGRVPSLEQEEQISNQQTVHDILNQFQVQQEQCNLDEISNQQTMQEILNQSQIQQEQNAIDETSNQQTVQDILNQPHVQQEQCNLDEIANQQTIQKILNQSQVQQEQNVQDILSQSQIQQEQNVTNETSNQQTVYDILNQSYVQQEEDSDDKTLIVLFKKKRCIIMPKSYYKQYQNKEYSYSSDNNE